MTIFYKGSFGPNVPEWLIDLFYPKGDSVTVTNATARKRFSKGDKVSVEFTVDTGGDHAVGLISPEGDYLTMGTSNVTLVKRYVPPAPAENTVIKVKTGPGANDYKKYIVQVGGELAKINGGRSYNGYGNWNDLNHEPGTVTILG